MAVTFLNVLKIEPAATSLKEGDGKPGGPELAKGPIGEKDNLFKMKQDSLIHSFVRSVLIVPVFCSKGMNSQQCEGLSNARKTLLYIDLYAAHF